MHLPPFEIHALFRRGLSELYIAATLRKIATALIGVFIPAYLLINGYSLRAVFLFYVIVFACQSLMVPVAAKLSTRIGTKHVMVLSMPLLLAFYLGLAAIADIRWMLAVLAALFGVSRGIYFFAWCSRFAAKTDSHNRAKEVGINTIFITLGAAFAPIIGGAIAGSKGFTIIFGIAAALLVVATLVLLRSPDDHMSIDFSLRQAFTQQKFRDVLGYMAWGTDAAATTTIWPMILFILFGSVEAVGLLSTIGLIAGAVITIILSHLTERNPTRILRVSAGLNIVVWAGRATLQTLGALIPIDFVGGLLRRAIQVPWATKSYTKANQTDLMEHMVFREMTINGTTALMFTILLIVGSWQLAFAFGILGSLFYFAF